jgi:hypothetical protein
MPEADSVRWPFPDPPPGNDNGECYTQSCRPAIGTSLSLTRQQKRRSPQWKV